MPTNPYRTIATRRWLRAQTPEMILLIRENYAAYLRCPFDETTDDLTDDDSTAFVYANFPRDIDENWRLATKQPDPYTG